MILQDQHKRRIGMILVIAMLSLLIVGVITADEYSPVINADLIQVDINQINGYEIPPTIGGYTILPGGMLDGVPDDFAPSPDACDSAAGSYVSPGIKAIRQTMIQFDNIVYDNKDPELVLYALYAMEANTFAELDAAFNNPQDMDKVRDFLDGEVVTIGDNSTCLTEGPLTARLWQLPIGTWVIESIQFNEPYDISYAWNVNPSPQLDAIQFDMPVLVEGVVVRYLMPYIEPPVTTVPANADQVASNPVTLCDGTAPSYLNIGADVLLNGYGYSQFPTNIEDTWEDWQFNGTQVALGDYGMNVYIDILHETPLTGIVGNFDSVMLEPEELYQGINFGTVVDGPYCTSINAEPAWDDGGNVVEGSDPDHDRFYTWWMIDINGTVGWYPEVVGQYSHWLWNQEGMFNRKLTMYYMIPANVQQAQANTCPPSNMYAGIEVQPSAGAMNLRTAPNGDVMGRLDAEETIILLGGPSCEGGSNWWSTERGYVAENDPETHVALLLPASQQAREAARMEEETTDETIVVTPVPSTPEPQETPVPDDDDDKKDKKRKNKDKDSNRADTCNPAPGAGC